MTAKQQIQLDLRLTLSDIAGLARVQRPVVSMWRSRNKHTHTPFPLPVGVRGRQELFDAAEVTGWLSETGRGNNPQAREDAAAFASPPGPDTKIEHFTALTALLALRCLRDSPLGSHSVEDLLDMADECDPDDELLYSELENVGGQLLPLARYADQLSNASYTAAAAFELLLDRAGPDSPAQGRTALTPEAVDLAVSAALELAAGSLNPPVFMDDGGSGFLPAVADILGEAEVAVLCVGAGSDAAARLAWRRMQVLGRYKENLRITRQPPPPAERSASVVRFAQFPSPSHPLTDAVQVLAAIDEMALGMEGHATAVVLAPASILTDALPPSPEGRDAGRIRSDILRSARIRAIVRLPQGLVPAKPRQAMALWVLGEAHNHVEIPDRWTMVANLTGVDLNKDVLQDLVGDLAASLGDRTQIRAHSFRFTTLVLTRSLLAGSGSLTAAAPAHRTPQQRVPSHAEASSKLVAAEDLLTQVRDGGPPLAALRLVAGKVAPRPPCSVGEALKDGSLKYLPGLRVDAGHLEAMQSGSAQFTIIGPEEVSGQQPWGSRKINQLVMANAYPQGRLTEPGDVIFTTGAQGSAVVDEAGSGVVLYPARILRIGARNKASMLPQMLAQDFRNAPPGPWRQRTVRRVDTEVKPALDGALAQVAAERHRLAVRLAQLDELGGALLEGVVNGHFGIVDTPREGTS
ncbi:hypothetical protein [Arthrobacter sp. H35-D1]|uniref:hypothetical protein n=1 Tax=Arthrobacter sp. H35-D1 TaxID=3046202 RepID=UPI0024BA986F|nr:hypothetical protein [Arthrobacter sp. H35-D1]MDJ0312719.1 hypothetical protein [Arthrobacter sp. H35-D1]